MRHVNMLIKPAAGLCNMRCRYCFYHDLSQNRAEEARIMTLNEADILIEKALADAEEAVSFAFQGGEPTLAGLEYFRHFTARVRELCPPEITVSYAIQTNGMLIDDEWAKFLAENGFLVGVSLDGPAELNDMHRVDMKLSGTHSRILRAIKTLEKHGVQYNILIVVTGAMARRARSVYTWLKKQGFRYLQFIACLEPLGAERGMEKYALTPERYGVFLSELFDIWYEDWKAGNYHSIRLFDDYVHIAAGFPSGTCATSGQCGGYLVVESDGAVYPCDFYVTDELRLGSIIGSGFAELMQSEKNKKFIADAAELISACAGCEYFRICKGGCRRDRQQASGGLGENYLCPAFKRFFAHALSRILEIAEAERRAAMQYRG